MLGRTYEREVCSAARALEVAGERWSLLILRNAAFAGMKRFTEFQSSLGVAPNILSARLAHFVDEGLMAVVSPADSGVTEYQLTRKGLDFKPVIAALTAWGDRWAAPDGAPMEFVHTHCGGRARVEVCCERCGELRHLEEWKAQKTPAMNLVRKRRSKRRE